MPLEDIYAKFAVITTHNDKDGLEFAPSEEYKKAQPPVVLRSEDLDMLTFGTVTDRFEASLAKEKGAENDYNYLYLIGIHRLSAPQ